MQTHQKTYDFLIAGSGFAGSITALCLNSAGFSVCLAEKNQHPRFAIGESSTPIADMILRDLSKEYSLPELRKLSRYGSWQKHYPGVTCGLKRGFSYYKHVEDQPFSSDQHHTNELLVAASVDNENSDTQWYRPDVDQLFVQMVADAGIDYLDQTEIQSVNKTSSGKWIVEADQNDDKFQVIAGFIIDATGSSQFSNRFFGTTSSDLNFHTNTRAIYSHFENVPEWSSYLDQRGFKNVDYPYNPDYSALHHLMEPGWLWMLRFNSSLVSAGLMLDGQDSNEIDAEQKWQDIISSYPSLKKLFSESRLANMPGKIIGTNRLQRRLDKMVGVGWAALHHTAGFVDPLHSTGIAHSLAGVEKLVKILIETHMDQSEQIKNFNEYQEAFFKEIELIDLLAAGCYKSRHHFELFTAWAMLYFTCTIQYEQQRLSGDVSGQFLMAGHPELSSIVRSNYNKLLNFTANRSSQQEINQFINQIRKNIAPYNLAGLMDPDKHNMYHHTAVQI